MGKQQQDFFEMSTDEPTAIQMSQQDQLYNDHKRYGKHKCFWFKNGEPQIVIGPHWYLSILVVGMMIFFGQIMHNITLQVKNVGWGYQCISQLIIILDVLFFIRTATKNEGIVTPENQCSEGQQKEICNICQVRIDSNTEHCDECDSCIQDMDHHCIWTGKCIGKGNSVTFYLFLSFTFGFFIYISLLAFVN